MGEKQELILARKRMLNDQLEKLKDRMTGRDNSFYPFITNRSGEISERKLESFIKELTDKPREYTNSNSFYLSRYEANRSYKKLCKCFLYCAIQGISDYNSAYYYPEKTASLFSDIVKLAEYENNTYFKNEEMLFEEEFDNAKYGGEFISSQELEYSLFHYCDTLYSFLTGNNIEEIIPLEVWRRCRDTEAQEQGFASAEDYEIACQRDIECQEGNWEAWLEYLESLDEKERARIEEEIEARTKWENELDEQHYNGNKKFIENYLKTVVSPEKYIKNYLDFRKLFFALSEYKRKCFFDDIVLMVDVFLYEHGLSPMTNDELYAEFDDHTDRLYAMMKRKPRKRGE